MSGDDLDDDFGARPVYEVVAERIVHGESRRTIAADLGLRLHQVNEHVAQAVRDWSGAAGTLRERMAILHMQVDDITARACAALGDDRGYEVTALLSVLVDVTKLRAGLLAAERRPQPEDGTG